MNKENAEFPERTEIPWVTLTGLFAASLLMAFGAGMIVEDSSDILSNTTK